MLKFTKIYFFLICLFIQLLFPRIGISAEGTITLIELKREIQTALFFAQREAIDPPYFFVKKIDLTINAVENTSLEAGVKIPILTHIGASGQYEKETSETIFLSLVPIYQVPVSADLKINFVEWLRNLKEAFNADTKIFDIINFDYKTKFQIRKNLEGELEFYVVSGSASKLNQYTHTIKIYLCETKDKNNCVGE